MHTRRENGRDVNRSERASERTPRSARPPPHARTASRPPPGPAPGGPCPPLCSAAGPAARLNGHTRCDGGPLHLQRGRIALRPSPPPPPNTHTRARITPTGMHPLALQGLGFLLLFFFSLGGRGWAAGGVPPPHLQHTRASL